MKSHNVAMLGTGLIGDFYSMTLHGQRGRDRVEIGACSSSDRSATAKAEPPISEDRSRHSSRSREIRKTTAPSRVAALAPAAAIPLAPVTTIFFPRRRISRF